ncbi:hypothetical protein [Rhodopirellula bahusiensis]|uniref:hypothetical protein n=1 Tax=Rhodopirellula bahusiensis TaxID=2014065 RepID=UPI003263F9B6
MPNQLDTSLMGYNAISSVSRVALRFCIGLGQMVKPARFTILRNVSLIPCSGRYRVTTSSAPSGAISLARIRCGNNSGKMGHTLVGGFLLDRTIIFRLGKSISDQRCNRVSCDRIPA